jgi:hypothetical protein
VTRILRRPDPEQGGGALLDGLLATSDPHHMCRPGESLRIFSRKSRHDDSGTDRKPTDMTHRRAHNVETAGPPRSGGTSERPPSAAAGGLFASDIGRRVIPFAHRSTGGRRSRKGRSYCRGPTAPPHPKVYPKPRRSATATSFARFTSPFPKGMRGSG